MNKYGKCVCVIVCMLHHARLKNTMTHVRCVLNFAERRTQRILAYSSSVCGPKDQRRQRRSRRRPGLWVTKICADYVLRKRTYKYNGFLCAREMLTKGRRLYARFMDSTSHPYRSTPTRTLETACIAAYEVSCFFVRASPPKKYTYKI